LPISETLSVKELARAEIVYSPGPLLRHPVKLLLSMISDLVAARHLAYRLLIRNLASQYRQSLLGYLWAFIPPVATTAGFVFLNSNGLLQTAQTNVPYPIYVFVGIILWQTFTDSLHGPLRWVSVYRSVVARVNFPREALILGALGEVAVNLAIRMILLALLLGWFGLGLASTAVFVPFAVLGLIGLGLVIGMVITPLGLLYGDIEKGTSLVTMLWLFLTPVFYPPPASGPATLLNQFNPVSHLLNTARELLLSGSVSCLSGFLAMMTLVAMSLFIGWVLFRLALPHLVERLGQ
jgi:lipopolysaccharide transport system permease protein